MRFSDYNEINGEISWLPQWDLHKPSGTDLAVCFNWIPKHFVFFMFCTQAITELELTYDMGFFKSKNSVFQTIPEVI